MTESKMREGECGKTVRGVLYCYIPRLGVRFCKRGATDAPSCRSGIRVTGDERHGRWVRRKVGRTYPLREFEV